MNMTSNIRRISANYEYPLPTDSTQLDRRPEQHAQAILREHLVDWPAEDLVGAHQHDGGGEVEREREQMRDDEDRHAAGAIQISEKRDNGRFGGDVHPGCRFVEDEYIGLGRERPGKEDALLLAA